MHFYRGCFFIALAALALHAQPATSYRYTVKGDEKTVEITNVNYQITGVGDIVLLRSTTKSKQVLGDMGGEASTTVEAWKVGVDIKTKPIYSVTARGTETRVTEGEIFSIQRGVEETEWWSVYRVANGAHLFDTHVPIVNFSTKRDTLTMRYVGLDVPEDPVKDAHLVGTIHYASADKVIRSAVITCDDPQQAMQMRSYADETRTLTGGKELRITFDPSYPAPTATIAIVIPIANDNLDLAHAQLPAKIHLK